MVWCGIRDNSLLCLANFKHGIGGIMNLPLMIFFGVMCFFLGIVLGVAYVALVVLTAFFSDN